MEIYTRSKPTKHEQSCAYCYKDMEKGEQQTVRVDWNRWGHKDSIYYHPKCGILTYLSSEDFLHHFEIHYPPIDADSFYKVYDSGRWRAFRANYILAPFLILASLHLDDATSLKFLEEVFTELTYKKVMGNG